LTRAQFTATSPQNYWEFAKASTPGGLRIKARELVTSVVLSATSTGAFQLANLPSSGSLTLSPVSFPRLSQIANAFEWYIFHKADILFQSNQPTTATGEILVCADYDAKDTAPTTSVGMMRNITATMSNIYSDASCQALKSLARLPRFSIAVSSSGDVEQLYQALVYVGVEGYTGTSGDSVGYLVIEYDVELFSPQ